MLLKVTPNSPQEPLQRSPPNPPADHAAGRAGHNALNRPHLYPLQTTLLDVLAGRKTVGKIEGEILYSGNKPTQGFLR